MKHMERITEKINEKGRQSYRHTDRRVKGNTWTKTGNFSKTDKEKNRKVNKINRQTGKQGDRRKKKAGN